MSGFSKRGRSGAARLAMAPGVGYNMSMAARANKLVMPGSMNEPGLTLEEMLVIAFAMGGDDAYAAVQNARLAIALLDGRLPSRQKGRPASGMEA